MKSRRWILWLSVIAFVTFVGMNLYQILDPHYLVDCRGTSGSAMRCFKNRSDLNRFTDDATGLGMTCMSDISTSAEQAEAQRKGPDRICQWNPSRVSSGFSFVA